MINDYLQDNKKKLYAFGYSLSYPNKNMIFFVQKKRMKYNRTNFIYIYNSGKKRN